MIIGSKSGTAIEQVKTFQKTKSFNYKLSTDIRLPPLKSITL